MAVKVGFAPFELRENACKDTVNVPSANVLSRFPGVTHRQWFLIKKKSSLGRKPVDRNANRSDNGSL